MFLVLIKKFNDQSVNWVDKNIYKIIHNKKKLKNAQSRLIFVCNNKYGNKLNFPRHIKIKLKKLKKKTNKLKKKLITFFPNS